MTAPSAKVVRQSNPALETVYGTDVVVAGGRKGSDWLEAMCGKRTWQKELNRSNVRPTLPDAVAGDITAALPYRTMVNIINFIKAMDMVVPGFASTEILLYAPEIKFYSNRIVMDRDFNTSVGHLFCLGNSSGWARDLMMTSMMEVLMGRRLA